MLDDEFLLYARYKSEKTRGIYKQGRSYTIRVRVGRFNQRVKLFAVDRETLEKIEGSDLWYENKKLFETAWKMRQDHTERLRG